VAHARVTRLSPSRRVIELCTHATTRLVPSDGVVFAFHSGYGGHLGATDQDASNSLR
jgi:hypothetical protein